MKLRREQWFYIVAVLASFGLHVGTLKALSSAARRRPVERPEILQMTVIKPAPKEVPKPPPPKPIDLTKRKRPPPLTTPPPPNTSKGEAPAKKARPVFGISMSSTVAPGQGAGMTVRVGNTIMKEPEKDFTPPEEVEDYAPVALHTVTRRPKPPPGGCPKEAYPESAKALRVEGSIRVELEIRADGTVGEVLILRGLGHGLDEAAVRGLKRCRFEPAMIGERPVATRIQTSYTFIYED